MGSDRNETQKTKKVITTLDSMPFGTDEQLQNMTRKVSKELPAGISSRMLYKDIMLIAWPAMAERAFAAVASMISMIMVGSLGPWAIASIGLAMVPRFLMFSTVASFNVGSTALIARSRGAGDRDKANAYLRQAMIMGVLFSIVLSVLGYVFAEPLIKLMGATEEASLVGGTVFLQVQALGFIFVGITVTITAALRGIGDSRSPMIYNTIATLVNILFNFLLIEGRWGFPRLEILGTSLAALFGHFVAVVIALAIMMRKTNYVSLNLRIPIKVNITLMRDILKIGLPAMGEQFILRIAMMVLNRIVASLGTNDFAAHHIAMNFMSFTMVNGEGFSTSATTLMGQSIGRKRPDMAQAYTSRCRRCGFVGAFVLTVFFIVMRHPLTSMYTDYEDVIKTSAYLILIMAFMQPFQASQFIIAGSLRGAGDTFAVAVVNFVGALIMRPVMTAIAVYILNYGAAGAWYAFFIDQLTRSTLTMLRFSSGKWKKVFFEKNKTIAS